MLSLDKRLTTFVELLKKSGMADKIENYKSPLTVFAPTNNVRFSYSSHANQMCKINYEQVKTNKNECYSFKGS